MKKAECRTSALLGTQKESHPRQRNATNKPPAGCIEDGWDLRPERQLNVQNLFFVMSSKLKKIPQHNMRHVEFAEHVDASDLQRRAVHQPRL